MLAGAGAGGEGVLFVNERVTATLTLNQTVVSGNVPDTASASGRDRFVTSPREQAPLGPGVAPRPRPGPSQGRLTCRVGPGGPSGPWSAVAPGALVVLRRSPDGRSQPP